MQIHASKDWALRVLLKEVANRRVRVDDREVLGREAVGRLMRRDPAVLEQVAAMAENGDDLRRELVTELLGHLAEPHRCFRQLEGRGTCAATAPAYCFLRDQPAEFARMVRELTCFGRARFPNGDVVQLPIPPGQADPWRRNTRVERMIQTAFMSYAARAPYNPDQDLVAGRRGLFENEQARLMTALYGHPYRCYPGSDQLQADGPVLAILRWDGEGHHAVSVTSVRQGKVYFRNPWGKPHGRRLTFTHETLQNGTERMSVLDFKSLTQAVIAPGPPRPTTLPEMPQRRIAMHIQPQFWAVGDRRYPSLAEAAREEPLDRRGVSIRCYEEVRPLPLYKVAAHTLMGGIMGAVFVSVAGMMLGAPAGPLAQAAGSIAVGALAYSNAKAMGKPVEVERGRLLCDQGQVLYQRGRTIVPVGEARARLKPI